MLCASKRSRQIRHLADGKRASGCSHATLSTGRPLPPALAAAGEPASDVLLMPCIRDARVQQAAAQACVWNAASDGTCVRHHRNRCDLNEVAAPDGVRLQSVGIIWVYPASPLTTGRRYVVGDRGSTGESHVARLFKFAPPMYSVRSRTGQWACFATRAASCSEAELIDRLLIVT